MRERIGIISSDFDPPIGGMGVYVKNLVSIINASGRDYQIISSSDPAEGDKHTKVWRMSTRDFGPIAFSVMVNLRLKRWIREHGITVLHINVGAGGFLLLWKPKLPVVATSHLLYSMKLKVYPQLKFRVLKMLEKITLKNCDVIISTSALMKRELIEEYGVSEGRIVIIEPGINLKLFKPLDRQSQPDRQSILYVGRMDDNKRVVELIEQVVSLKREFPSITLTLIGDGPTFDKALSAINTNQAVDYIKLHKKIENSSLPEYYRRSALTAIPSKYEAFGLVAAESIACGTPVIITNSSGFAEAVDKFGYFSSFDGTLSDLRSKIAMFLKNEKGEEHGRSQAINYVREFSDIKSNSAQILRAYDLATAMIKGP